MIDEKHKPWCSEQAREQNGACICKTEKSFSAPTLLDSDHRSEIVRRIRNHLAMLSPAARERRTAQLLTEAVDLIEAAERVIESKIFSNDNPPNNLLEKHTKIDNNTYDCPTIRHYE